MRRIVSAVLLFVVLLQFSCHRAFAIDLDALRKIGNAVQLTKEDYGVLIQCDDSSQVRLQVLAPDLVRVRASFSKKLPDQDFSWAIARTKWDRVPFTISDSAEKIVVETSELRVVIDRKPLLVSFYDRQSGQLINSDAEPMSYDSKKGSIAAAKSLAFEEHFYGLGEKAAHLDKRHGNYKMWSSDMPAYTWGTEPLYQSIPFYIGLLMEQPDDVWRSRAYGIFFDNSFCTHFDLASSNPERVTFDADGGEMNYYFFYGPSMKKVVGRYTELTGRMPLPPKWALGNQQCRYSYANEQQVKDVVSRYRKENIPLDVIYLDIHYMDGYRNFTWNKNRFPDPKGLTQWLEERGMKLVTIIDAGVKYEPGGSYDTYNEGASHNYFLKQSNGSTYIGKVWPGKSVFVDYTLPDAAKWWGDSHSKLLDFGVAGIWNDMNEPADFDSRDGEKWKDVINYDNGNYSKHEKMRNLFALLECKATFEGLQRLRPNSRPFIVTRSGFAGIQRYATMWTGDSQSTWSSLALSLPMFETLGLCGEAFIGGDCGGFMGESNGELLTRWYQMAFLTPLFRNHHCVDNFDQEPWRFGTRYEDIIRKYVQLRYQLMPYLYTVLAEANRTGVPLVRPLILEDQNDYNLLTIEDEFMVGSSILCAPVLKEGAVNRDVYLPKGEWYDYFSNEKYSGGQYVSVKAPLDTVPLFVKAGSIIPTGPVRDYIGQSSKDKISYDVYPDRDGKALGELYDDDGISTEYLKDVFTRLQLKFENGKLLARSTKDDREKVLEAEIRLHDRHL